MKRFYIFKDGNKIGSTCSKDLAIDFIRQYQKQETHYLFCILAATSNSGNN